MGTREIILDILVPLLAKEDVIKKSSSPLENCQMGYYGAKLYKAISKDQLKFAKDKVIEIAHAISDHTNYESNKVSYISIFDSLVDEYSKMLQHDDTLRDDVRMSHSGYLRPEVWDFIWKIAEIQESYEGKVSLVYDLIKLKSM